MLTFVFALALLFSAQAPPSTTDASASAPAIDPAALLAKHRAYVGWQADDGSLPSFWVDESWSTGAATPKPFLREVRRGMAFRDGYSATSDSESSSIGFTGNVFWTSDENGMISPIIGESSRFRLARDLLFSEGTTELPGTFDRVDTVDGTPVDVVTVSMEGAYPVHLYIDPTTGAYLRAVVDSGKDTVTYEIHSYLPVGTKQRIIGSYSIGATTFNFHDPKVGAVRDADLHPPTPTATWAFANDQPFHFDAEEEAFYIEAKINGVSGYFELDTGDGDTTLTDNFANRLHLKILNHGEAEGAQGIGTTLERKVDTIEVGGNTFSNVYVTTIDMQNYSDRKHRSIDGLLGYDFLAGAIVSFDPSKKTMRIQDPNSVKISAPSNSATMMVDLSGGVPVVPIDIDGLPFNAMMDSGNGFPVTVPKDAEKRGLTLANVLQRDALTISGENGLFCGGANDVHVGPIDYQAPMVCENPQMHGDSALVGFDFLRNFKFIFDYPESRIYMIPDPYVDR